MSENYSKKSIKLTKRSWLWWIILPAWTYAAFWLAQLVLVPILAMVRGLGVPIDSINEVLLTTVLSAVVYVLAVVIVIVVPLLVWKRRTSWKDIGISGWLSWLDLLITPAAFVVYLIASAMVMAVVMSVTSIDVTQKQEVLFTQSMLTYQWQYILAFLTLVILAPVAEELLFRGYLYGKLRKVSPAWLTIAITSLAFGAAHLWAGPGNPLQWAVMVDTFVLSIFMCLSREYTGAIWVAILMHIIKNGLAFYLLFVNPQVFEQIKASLMVTMGGL